MLLPSVSSAACHGAPSTRYASLQPSKRWRGQSRFTSIHDQVGAASIAALLVTAQRGLRKAVRSRQSARSASSLDGEGLSRSKLLRLAPGLSVVLGSAAQATELNNLRGRTAVVTGAGRGIGKGVALGLGEAGATVFVTGRSKGSVEATAELVTRAGGRGIGILCDHGDDAQVERAFAEISEKTSGKLDVLVNNAFKDPSSDSPEVDRLLSNGAKFYELPLSVWDDMHRVGLRSHYVSSYYAAPLLIAAAKAEPGRRPLICMTSSFGAVSYLFATAYGVGKAGSDRLVRDLQVELGPQGIDCLSIWPGLVLTEKVQELLERDPSRINRVTGGQDPARVGESPLLTGRIIAKLAAEEKLRRPPLVTPAGLTSQVCIVAEAARDLGLRDGGAPGSVAAEVYGTDRNPAPSIRSLGFLGPGPLRSALPEALKGLAAPGGPLANEDVRVPLEFMAQGPPPPPEK
eukprot:TRINITY_DN67070_c0_g1_i1.p1 TRINITY_DN67070_c0_g1~~TRINITY_DN67070_c0_g1_i1.p1  ORF type:complete len:460 (-),score=85.05 TRINITY_DN67070_c0_g1_i1:50-1429(-)